MIVTASSQQHECKYPYKVDTEPTDPVPLQIFEWCLVQSVVKDKDKYHINVIEQFQMWKCNKEAMHKSDWTDPPRYVPVYEQWWQKEQCPDVVNQKCLLAKFIQSIHLVLDNDVKYVEDAGEYQDDPAQVICPEIFCQCVISLVAHSVDRCYEERHNEQYVAVDPDVVEGIV